MVGVLGALAIAVVATGVVWVGSSRLERSADRLATHYGVPAAFQGAVIAAIGSSFPELSSVVVAALLHGKFELGVAAIVGSAIFNILVIPALATLLGDGDLGSTRELVYRDAQFYMLAVAVLLVTFSFAVIYFPTGDGPLTGEITRELALIPLSVYGLYVFIQYLDLREHVADPDRHRVNPLRAWAILAGSLVVILVGVEGLVRAAIALGEAFGTSEFVWGLTVIAAGTSLPDAIVSIQAARRKEGVASAANVLGSNIFDLLVAVPIGVLIVGSGPVDFARAAPMMGALTLATVLLFALLRTGLTLSRAEGVGLLATYGVFVGWILAEAAALIDLIP